MIPIHHKIAGAIKSFGLQAQWVPPSLSKVEAKFYIEYRMAARLNPQKSDYREKIFDIRTFFFTLSNSSVSNSDENYTLSLLSGSWNLEKGPWGLSHSRLVDYITPSTCWWYGTGAFTNGEMMQSIEIFRTWQDSSRGLVCRLFPKKSILKLLNKMWVCVTLYKLV